MVKKPVPIVQWDKQAYVAFQKIFEYIKQDSPANADKVRFEILRITHSLPEHPEKYPPDKLKKENPGNYRAFEKYSYRIAYKHTDQEIRILRISHVKQEPKTY
jgi:plasmid stabilization system protein ParE